jgi:hypothetical protein
MVSFPLLTTAQLQSQFRLIILPCMLIPSNDSINSASGRTTPPSVCFGAAWSFSSSIFSAYPLADRPQDSIDTVYQDNVPPDPRTGSRAREPRRWVLSLFDLDDRPGCTCLLSESQQVKVQECLCANMPKSHTPPEKLIGTYFVVSYNQPSLTSSMSSYHIAMSGAEVFLHPDAASPGSEMLTQLSRFRYLYCIRRLGMVTKICNRAVLSRQQVMITNVQYSRRSPKRGCKAE